MKKMKKLSLVVGVVLEVASCANPHQPTNHAIEVYGKKAVATVNSRGGKIVGYEVEFEDKRYGIAWMQSSFSGYDRNGNGIPDVGRISIRCLRKNDFGLEWTGAVYEMTERGWAPLIYGDCAMPANASELALETEDVIKQAVKTTSR